MSRLCVHTITTKPLTLEQCLAEYPKRGIGGITIWRPARRTRLARICEVQMRRIA